jgi:phenylalanyl-tRNA synthetase beta chain
LLLKDLLVASGYSEVMNLSLISKDLIESSLLASNSHIRISNPVSKDYEYLRMSLIPGLMNAVLLNQSLTSVQLFELDKVYLGKPGKTVEPYRLAGITNKEGYRKLKGLIDILFTRLHIGNIDIKTTEALSGLWHPVNSGNVLIGKDLIGTFGEIHPKVREKLGIKEKVFAFEFAVDLLYKYSRSTIYKTIPKYPAQIEDITFTFPPKTKIGEALSSIKLADSLISNVELTDIYLDSYTFRIWYLNPKKTLIDKEVEDLRKKVLDIVKTKFGGQLKN